MPAGQQTNNTLKQKNLPNLMTEALGWNKVKIVVNDSGKTCEELKVSITACLSYQITLTSNKN